MLIYSEVLIEFSVLKRGIFFLLNAVLLSCHCAIMRVYFYNVLWNLKDIYEFERLGCVD